MVVKSSARQARIPRFSVVVYVAVGGDESNYASFLQAVRSPPDSHFVQVLEGICQLGGATGGICFAYPLFEMFMWDVGVVVACAFLSMLSTGGCRR